MRIPSGVTDQYVYFVAVDSTDYATRETGLSSFTVYRSRNGGASSVMTTPTINETDTTNMPGVYELLLDEDMTIDAGDDSQEMIFHITHAGMAPVTRTIELYRSKITAGNTLDVTATGAAGIDWGNVENPTTAVDLSGTDIQLCDTVTTLTGHTAQTGDNYARLGAPAGASVSADVAAVKVDTAQIGVAGAGLTDLGGMSTAMKAEVNAEADTALTDYDPPTNTELTARTLASASYATSAAQTTAQNDLDIITGADGVNLLSATQASVDAIEADTNELQGDWVDGGRLDLILDARMAEASINTTGGAVDTVTTVTTCTTNTDMVAAPTTLLTTQMTEAYAADGTAPTLAQALFLIQQTIGDFAIAGTTITVKKLDGSTTAAQYLLDDGTNPTSRTRSS